MFSNIGEKVKGLALFAAILGIVVSIAGGIVIIATSESLAAVGILVMIVGSLVSWIGSWVIYAIGDTNTKVTVILADIAIKESEKEAKTEAVHNVPGSKAKINAEARPASSKKSRQGPAPQSIADADDSGNGGEVKLEYIRVRCPNPECGEDLEFTSFDAEQGELVCPYCDAKIDL